MQKNYRIYHLTKKKPLTFGKKCIKIYSGILIYIFYKKENKMKRRILSFLLMALAISLILALTACDGFLGGYTPEDHEHEWSDWEIKEEPTCRDMGIKSLQKYLNKK